MHVANKNSSHFSQDKPSDCLDAIEIQLNELWSQYVKRVDEAGLDEIARSLRDKYFNIYNGYRQKKKWFDAINN